MLFLLWGWLLVTTSRANVWPMRFGNAACQGRTPVIGPASVPNFTHVRVSNGNALDPVVGNGVVYLGENFIVNGRTTALVSAINASDGALIWAQAYSEALDNAFATGEDRLCFVMRAAASQVQCVSVQSGEALWSQRLPNSNSNYPARNILIHEGSVIAVVASVTYSFNVSTGQLLWQYDTGLAPAGRTLIILGVQGHVILVFGSHFAHQGPWWVASISVHGAVMWNTTLTVDLCIYNALATPDAIIAVGHTECHGNKTATIWSVDQTDGAVVHARVPPACSLSGFSSGAVALGPDAGGPTLRLYVPSVCALDVPRGAAGIVSATVAWSFDAQSPDKVVVVDDSGTLYMTHRFHAVTALNASTGREKWKRELLLTSGCWPSAPSMMVALQPCGATDTPCLVRIAAFPLPTPQPEAPPSTYTTWSGTIPLLSVLAAAMAVVALGVCHRYAPESCGPRSRALPTRVPFLHSRMRDWS